MSTLKAVPKITKGEWKLPKIANDGSLIAEELKSQRQKDEELLIEVGLLKQPGSSVPKDWGKKELPEWRRQDYARKEKLNGARWLPTKKVSREAMEGIRYLKKEQPDLKISEIASHFKIPYDAVRRILKSKWRPSADEEQRLQKKWIERGKKLQVILREKEGLKISKQQKTFISKLSRTAPKINHKIRERKDVGNMMF